MLLVLLREKGSDGGSTRGQDRSLAGVQPLDRSARWGNKGRDKVSKVVLKADQRRDHLLLTSTSEEGHSDRSFPGSGR